jgi:hypothetical protein
MSMHGDQDDRCNLDALSELVLQVHPLGLYGSVIILIETRDNHLPSTAFLIAKVVRKVLVNSRLSASQPVAVT